MNLLHVSTSTRSSEVHIKACKHNIFCQRCACVQLKYNIVNYIITSKKLKYKLNIFYTSKQYFIFHCRQTSMSIFVIFSQRGYTGVVCLVFMPW